MVLFGLEPSVETLAQPIAGLAMFALAAWLFFLNAGDRLHQILALFLVFRGLVNVLNPFLEVARPSALAEALAPYFDIATFFAALVLVLVYRQRYAGARRSLALQWGLVAGGLLVELLYFLDHSIVGTRADPGPLGAFAPLRRISYLVIALLLQRDSAGQPVGPRRQSLHLASIGFALDAVFSAVFLPLQALIWPIIEFGSLYVRLSLFEIVASLVLVAYLAMQAVRAPDASLQASARRYLLILAIVVASAALALAAPLASRDAAIRAYVVFDAIWTLALPALLAYAIVRHQLFGIEVKIKWTIRQSTVAAIFVAVIFMVSESAQEVFSNEQGPVFGILAAGLLVFFIAPLQRFAERFANVAMPGVKSISDLTTAERLRLFRHQVQIAWSDRMLSLDERRMLDEARKKLGLTDAEASAIERDVLGGLGGARGVGGERGEAGEQTPVNRSVGRRR